MIRYFYFTLITCLFAAASVSCSSTKLSEDDYKKASLQKLSRKPLRYAGKTIAVEAYILGTEFHPSL